MTVVIINPNSTASMTEAMLSQARAAAPTVHFEGWTSHAGPPAIQGPEDGATAIPPLLDLVSAAIRSGAQGIIIGCFDDTGLPEAQRMASCPVLGIGQASYHYAALRDWRFSVVTTLEVSVPVIEDNIRTHNLAPYLGRVRASDVPVLALETDTDGASRLIAEESKRAAAEDGIDAVILGCAGMVQVIDDVGAALSIPAIDPVACTVRCMSWLIAQDGH